jgi:hypothetical protein
VTEENNKQFANCGFRDEEHDLPKNSFNFKTPYCLRVNAYKVNLFAPKEKRGLPDTDFLKITNPQWHYMRISGIEFYPNQTINVERRD